MQPPVAGPCRVQSFAVRVSESGASSDSQEFQDAHSGPFRSTGSHYSMDSVCSYPVAVSPAGKAAVEAEAAPADSAEDAPEAYTDPAYTAPRHDPPNSPPASKKARPAFMPTNANAFTSLGVGSPQARARLLHTPSTAAAARYAAAADAGHSPEACSMTQHAKAHISVIHEGVVEFRLRLHPPFLFGAQHPQSPSNSTPHVPDSNLHAAVKPPAVPAAAPSGPSMQWLADGASSTQLAVPLPSAAQLAGPLTGAVQLAADEHVRDVVDVSDVPLLSSHSPLSQELGRHRDQTRSKKRSLPMLSRLSGKSFKSLFASLSFSKAGTQPSPSVLVPHPDADVIAAAAASVPVQVNMLMVQPQAPVPAVAALLHPGFGAPSPAMGITSPGKHMPEVQPEEGGPGEPVDGGTSPTPSVEGPSADGYPRGSSSGGLGREPSDLAAALGMVTGRRTTHDTHASTEDGGASMPELHACTSPVRPPTSSSGGSGADAGPPATEHHLLAPSSLASGHSQRSPIGTDNTLAETAEANALPAGSAANSGVPSGSMASGDVAHLNGVEDLEVKPQDVQPCVEEPVEQAQAAHSSAIAVPGGMPVDAAAEAAPAAAAAAAAVAAGDEEGAAEPELAPTSAATAVPGAGSADAAGMPAASKAAGSSAANNSIATRKACKVVTRVVRKMVPSFKPLYSSTGSSAGGASIPTASLDAAAGLAAATAQGLAAATAQGLAATTTGAAAAVGVGASASGALLGHLPAGGVDTEIDRGVQGGEPRVLVDQILREVMDGIVGGQDVDTPMGQVKQEGEVPGSQPLCRKRKAEEERFPEDEGRWAPDQPAVKLQQQQQPAAAHPATAVPPAIPQAAAAVAAAAVASVSAASNSAAADIAAAAAAPAAGALGVEKGAVEEVVGEEAAKVPAVSTTTSVAQATAPTAAPALAAAPAAGAGDAAPATPVAASGAGGVVHVQVRNAAAELYGINSPGFEHGMPKPPTMQTTPTSHAAAAAAVQADAARVVSPRVLAAGKLPAAAAAAPIAAPVKPAVAAAAQPGFVRWFMRACFNPRVQH